MNLFYSRFFNFKDSGFLASACLNCSFSENNDFFTYLYSLGISRSALQRLKVLNVAAQAPPIAIDTPKRDNDISTSSLNNFFDPNYPKYKPPPIILPVKAVVITAAYPFDPLSTESSTTLTGKVTL